MYTEEKRYSVLARQLKNFDYLLIDTCSLMDESFPDWMNVFEKAKKEYVDDAKDDFHAYVPYRCYEELKKHAKAKEKTPELIEKQIAAKRALRIVKWAKFRKVLEITKKDKEENYADNAITVKVIHDRLDKRILVITQDKGLASDLLYWNHSQSQRGKYVAVYCIDSNGELAPNRGKTNSSREPQKNYKPNTQERNAQPKQQQAQKPAPASKKPDYDAISQDKRLKALLTNPNYPMDKKKKDVQAHLEGLSSLPEEKRKPVPLLLSEGMLRQFLLTGTLGEKKQPQPAQVKTQPQKPVEEPVLEEKPKEMTVDALMKKFRYGEGLSLKEAISQCGAFYNVMFRYHSIPYNAQFHGPIDLTEEDLDALARLADQSLEGNSLIHVGYKDIVLYVLPRNVTFRVWMDLSLALPKPAHKEEPKHKQDDSKKSKNTAKPAPKKEEKQDNDALKSEPKQEMPQQEKKEKGSKKADEKAKEKPIEKPAKQKEDAPKAAESNVKKPKKATKKAAPEVKEPTASEASPKSLEQKPEPKKSSKKKQEPKASASLKADDKASAKEEPKAKLADEKPAEDKKPVAKGKAKATKAAAPTEQPAAKKEKKKAEPKKEAAKPEAKKKQPAEDTAKDKPSKKKKPAETAVEKPQAAKQPEVSKPNPSPKKAKQEKVKEQPASNNEKKQKNTEKPQQKPAEKQSLFEEAKAADMRLKANINNSNYPVKSKINDLKMQLERVKKLKVEERGALSYSIDMIKTMINMLEAAK